MNQSIIAFSRVGFWGIPGKSRATKTHLVHGGKPLCGSAIGDKMEFQWCANRPVLEYVECERCKQIYRKNA